MKHKTPQAPKDYLDQRKLELAQKHSRRLQQMSNRAIQSRQRDWRQSNWFTPAIGTALTALLITTVIFLGEPEEQPNSTTLTSLPAWVTDTNAPVTLIENLEFYDWLAQQTENQNAKSPTHFTVAINEYYQYRFSQRLSSSNLAERFSRAIAYSGAIQK